MVGKVTAIIAANAVLFWALWAIMWGKCPLSLRQLPVHHAFFFASECSTAYLSTMNPHWHRQRQQWHKGTQWLHTDHTWWQTRKGLVFKSRLRVYFFFFSFFSLLLIFFFFGIRLRLCVQKPQASRRGMATLEEEWATTGCREGMTTSAPTATATSATVARQLQGRD